MDVLIPAAVTDSINDKNKNEIRAKIIVEKAQTFPGENLLKKIFQKKVFWSCRIFVANAGGVISSLMPNIEATTTKKCSNWLKKKKKKCDNGRIETKPFAKENRNPREVAMGIGDGK